MKATSSLCFSIFCILFSLFCTHVSAQSDGSLDLSFGTGGIASLDYGSSNGENAYAVAMQTDGKIVAAGVINTEDNDVSFGITRCLPNGIIDSSFGDDGWVMQYIEGWAWAYAVCIQDDGKIVAVGLNYNFSFGYDVTIVRLEEDGSFDESFGLDGIVTTNISNENEQTYDAIIQPDGKILVAGFRDNDISNTILLIRYNTDGSPDTDFGTDGIVLSDLSTESGVAAYAIALQHDGKIILGGHMYNNEDVSDDFLIVRYLEDGNLDATFGTGGYVTTDFTGYEDECWDIKIQDDEKIVASGYSFNGVDWDFATARYGKNGLLDPEFNGDGKVATDFDGRNDRAFGSVIQPDGKIVVAGYSSDIAEPYESIISMVRYNSDGSPDTGFDGDGKVITPAGISNCSAYAITLQPDEKIVLAGSSENDITGGDLTILRYNGPELPDNIVNENATCNIFVSPNPVADILHIHLQLNNDEIQEIILTDMSGKGILRQTLTEEETFITIKDLMPGVYLLSYIEGNSIMKVIPLTKM